MAAAFEVVGVAEASIAMRGRRWMGSEIGPSESSETREDTEAPVAMHPATTRLPRSTFAGFMSRWPIPWTNFGRELAD